MYGGGVSLYLSSQKKGQRRKVFMNEGLEEKRGGERMRWAGEVSVSGNVHCPYCGQWTGKNVHVDNPPYICEWCGEEVVTR